MEKIEKTNYTMMIDFYEFTMAQTYFDKGEKDRKVYFDVFFRSNPFDGGYTISGGLDSIIDYINNFKFTKRDINYLRSTGCFKEDFLNYLKDLKFTGDMYAVPEGTPVFPNEPVLIVKANIIEAQLIETAILASFNHGALVTTAAKRITEAAKAPVMEFGARRARGIASAVEASKYAYVGGCIGTSNTMTAMINDIPALGTMAHSLVSDADSEYEAFLDYARSNPNNAIFLVDTYDTLRSGVPNAIKVAKEYLEPNGHKFKGIRIDSGDLAYLSKEARKMMDKEGFKDAKITLSNGLNEESIKMLIEEDAKFDSLGVGDNISAAKERVGGVYKLVAVELNGDIVSRIKVSEDSIKTITPGYKKLYRFFNNKTGYAEADVIALHDEVMPEDRYKLIHPIENHKTKVITDYTIKSMLVPIYKNGKLVYNLPNLHERQEYCNNEFKKIYPEVKRSVNPHEHIVDLSEKLLNLKKYLIDINTKGKTRKLVP